MDIAGQGELLFRHSKALFSTLRIGPDTSEWPGIFPTGAQLMCGPEDPVKDEGALSCSEDGWWVVNLLVSKATSDLICGVKETFRIFAKHPQFVVLIHPHGSGSAICELNPSKVS